MAAIKTLNQVLLEEFGKKTIETIKLPDHIRDNLNPAFTIRPYQESGLRFFLKYWEDTYPDKPGTNHRLLFHMATGSGKTLMMAALLLHLYAKGHRHFLFFVNSTNIITKTKANFLTPASSKYLFAPMMTLAQRPFTIRECSNFQAGSQDDVNIVFATVQGLHLSLNTPSENGLTYEDFAQRQIVLISDEAHHINAETKRVGGAGRNAELFDVETWEGTVERLFRANAANVLLEFTATMDLSHEQLAAKYAPKLIFDYPLREFRKDGYSKEIKVLQADMAPFQRALIAVLLSQYRRKLFGKHGKAIKPVILFKSKTIRDSKAFHRSFVDGIRNLTGTTLASLEGAASHPAVLRMFHFFRGNGITPENLAVELRSDFAEERLIEVNSKEDSESKQLAINSLEDEHNEYRAVFAVDKLNEGWDVLNLFDIVRLYDTRDSRAGRIGKTTMSEAQLIGRGARYCPFRLGEGQALAQRKFDSDLTNEMRICEELIYHSTSNPKYIQELNAALTEIGLMAKEVRERQLALKKSFRATPLYASGHIYLNSRQAVTWKNFTEVDSSILSHTFTVELLTGAVEASLPFEGSRAPDTSNDVVVHEYKLADFGTNVLRKATQRVAFYEFSSLRRFFPNLKSMREFIESDTYLAQIRVDVVGRSVQVDSLGPEDRLMIATSVVAQIGAMLQSEMSQFRGTKRFTPKLIRETFHDKEVSFVSEGGAEREFGRSMNDPAETNYPLNLSTRDWYAFNDCYGTSEEKLLVKFIDKKYGALKLKYASVHLVRNEKHFSLYNFSDGKAFEPDYVLFLVGRQKRDTVQYQVFIEPKGAHLAKGDEWKQQFLLAIRNSAVVEQLFHNKHYAVWGLPFFNSEEEGPFDSAFEGQLLDS